jgi:cellobiose-specific phosphotransferase system component IIA
MVFFYRSPQAIVISALCSIAIAAFIYFVIVKPETDKANTQVDHALKQAQPSIDAANKQLEQAQPEINKAQKLQQCILAAGTDAEKIAACNN